MSANQATARSRPSFESASAGTSDETRNAVNKAFDALSDWRQELVESAERNGNKVFDNMAAAAKAMGWPSEIVEATRNHMQNASKMQLQVIDQVMDLWEQQVKSPSSFNFSAAMERFPLFPGSRVEGQLPLPDMRAFANMNPVQFWMQAADMWQKNWTTAMSSWMGQAGGGPRGNGGSRAPGPR